MLEVASGVMYAGGRTSRSAVAVPELTADGSDEQELDKAPGRNSGKGHRLHGGDEAAASVPVSHQQTLRGVRRLLQHAAAQHPQAAAAGLQDADDAWDGTSGAAHAGSSSSSRKLSAIFGRDTRTEIKDPPRDPFFSPTGHLLFKDPATRIRYQCTGALIGPYTVLTAAHCLVKRDGVQQANIEFTAGQTFSNFTGLGTAKGLHVYFNKEFLGPQWEQYDYGILLIDRPFGLYTDAAYYAAVMDIAEIKAQETNGKPSDVYKQFTLPAGWTPKRYGYAFGTAPMKNLRVMSAGYPGEARCGWLLCTGCCLDEAACRLQQKHVHLNDASCAHAGVVSYSRAGSSNCFAALVLTACVHACCCCCCCR
jgi:V8-like Glu-specific endopeptidase